MHDGYMYKKKLKLVTKQTIKVSEEFLPKDPISAHYQIYS